MKTGAWALCAALLCGCASQPQQHVVPPPPTALFQDQRFTPLATPINVDEIFAVSDEMKQYLQEHIVHNQHGKEPRQALFDALYRKDKLQLEYDSAMTRNAAQTFKARAGNCMSLAIMTAALARELNLKVQFQRITVDDSWSRTGSLYFSATHVNLILGTPKLEFSYGYNSTQNMTIDFIPVPEHARLNAQPLTDNTVIAMYMNNRAAEQLVQGKVDEAYWWARKAISYDRDYLNSYNTLGVIYQHHGDLEAAAGVLRFALNMSPDNTVIMFNLAQALQDTGHPAEAAGLRSRLAALEPYPPFYFFTQGQEAMKIGDYVKARSLFLRELDRAPDYHEFHFWLALADYKLGNLKDADEHMTLALENSTTRNDHDLYSAKLDRIKAYEAHPTGRP